MVSWWAGLIGRGLVQFFFHEKNYYGICLIQLYYKGNITAQCSDGIHVPVFVF